MQLHPHRDGYPRKLTESTRRYTGLGVAVRKLPERIVAGSVVAVSGRTGARSRRGTWRGR